MRFTADKLIRKAKRGLGREAARLRSWIAGPRARIVYDDRYAFPSNDIADRDRAKKILEHVEQRGWLTPGTLVAPPPLALVDLVRVHDPSYLETLDDPKALARIFGQDVPMASAAAFLGAERWAAAGTVHASELALRSARRSRQPTRAARNVVVNLGGGFHHAFPDRGAGFCAFNDMAAAIGRLRAGGFDGRVLVVDVDLHHGDGTRACFRTDERVFTYSLHANDWDTEPAIASLDVELGPAVGDETYLDALHRTLPEFFARAAPEIVFFVAGVDIADGDTLGAYRVSPDGVFARDRFVLDLAGSLPVVMVLAGGYGPEAWRHTARTVLWLLSGEDAPIPSRDELALMRFRAIRKRLGASAFAQPARDAEPNIGITQEDIYGDLVDKRADPKLLGFYTPFGIEVAFERYGLAAQLRARGYPRFEIALDAIGTSGRGFRVYADATREEVLMEIVLSEYHGLAPYRLLSIEWLLLQDPHRAPSAEADLLPGQRYGGLGALKFVVGILVMTCERLGFDGLTFMPAHFHVAARARRLLQFVEPADEAMFLALSTATSSLGLKEASRSIADGHVVERSTGNVVTHVPARMVLPVSAALKERVTSPAYAHDVETAARRIELELVA